MAYNNRAKILLKHSRTTSYHYSCARMDNAIKGELLDLVKKMKPQAELERARVRLLIQNNKQLASFIDSIQNSYVCFFSGLDVLVKTHKIPSVGSLTKVKPIKQVWQEIEEYLEQLIHIPTKEDLDLNKQNIQNYIGGPS